MSDLQPVRGTRDFYPEDMRFRNWLFDHFREVARLFGFSEYDAPILENEGLYTRKQGEEIVAQLYAFEDKGGRRVSLRPEMTPSLARMVMANTALPMPLKWFSIPQCWRYERAMRGRKREHYQWNMDIWGVEGIEAEVELLSAIVTLFKRIGLDSNDVGIKINSRKILQQVLTNAGVTEEQFSPVCIIVDKIDKVPLEVIEKELGDLGLDSGIIETINNTLAIKSVDKLSEVLGTESDAVNEISQLWGLAAEYGIVDWLEFDASVVRGLAYYTGVVFEAFDRSGELRAICGGGRYDTLLSTFGGQDKPACGFGFGDVVIAELLSDKGIMPALDSGIDDVIFSFNEELRSAAMNVASLLRNKGRSVDLVLENRKMKWGFKHAHRAGAKRVVLLTPEEWSMGKIRVRDMTTGEEKDLALDEL